jgi:hypothetical protein
MKTRTLMIAVTVLMLTTGSAFAQMGGGGMGAGSGSMMPGPMPGPGPGPNPGPTPGPMPGPGMGNGKGNGMGYGMNGAGGMVSGMMSNSKDFEYLDVLTQIGNEVDAEKAVQAFLEASNSNLVISVLWEYGTVYKAELSDKTGAMAFDLMVDKFTGAVSPEMGMSMMLNASYGKAMYKTSSFGKNLALTPQQATDTAQKFLDNNKNVLVGYILDNPEIYPGYYKFHTTTGTTGTGFGMDIMVNGYNGEVWMNTFLGLPIAQHLK